MWAPPTDESAGCSPRNARSFAAISRALDALAHERGQTLAEMSLAWILRDDSVTSVLIGASRPEQILDNIAAIRNTVFTDEELRRIDEICGL